MGGDGERAGAPEVPGLHVTHRLGAGGAGTVWAATRDSDGRLLAVKVVWCPDEAAATRAAREAAVLGQVRVEGLVGFHAAYRLATDPPSVALVLDRVDGGSVEQAVRARGHLSVGETVTVLTPVARTLAGLHAVGVVHGDLTPGNVLLERSGRPTVCDLGLSRLSGEQPDDLFGTDGFVAPEVVAGASTSPASDVYALGALAWWCATGSAPGPGTTRGNIEDLAPGLPALWRQTTLDALSADPGRRPTAAEAALAYFDSARAEPLRLVVGGDDSSLLTRRLRQSAATEDAVEPSRERSLARLGRAPRGRPARGRRGHERRRPRAARPRLLVAAILAVALVAGGSWALHWRRGAQAAEATPAAHGAVAVPSWALSNPLAPQRDARGLMQGLADLRAAAMNRADLDALPRFDAPGSPALDSDTTDFLELTTTGTRYVGVTLRVRTARLFSVGALQAVVEAVVDTGSYRVVGAFDGTTVAASAGSPLLFTLVWTQGQWRIFRVENR